MFFYSGLTCPVCNKPFQDTDDIVACPVCGLPHHRACWKQQGHCHLEHLHGTQDQWSREQAVHSGNAPQQPEQQAEETFSGQICSRCHTRNPEFAEICTHCGAVLRHTEWRSEQQAPTPPSEAEYSPFTVGFSPWQTYSPEEVIGEYKAKELAAVVGQNAAYYIPRFRNIENHRGGGWNWAAFFLAPYWLLFRKQYLLGMLFFFCQMVYSFAYSYFLYPIQSAETTEQMAQAINSLFSDETSLWFLLPIFILSAILLCGKILLGLKGNQLYKASCENRIRKAREKVPDMSAGELASLGGTSPLLAMVFYIIPTVLSSVLMFLQVM